MENLVLAQSMTTAQLVDAIFDRLFQDASDDVDLVYLDDLLDDPHHTDTLTLGTALTVLHARCAQRPVSEALVNATASLRPSGGGA